MSDLPHDLLEEILSRVRAASLKGLRSTCKRWNSLFTDKGFTEKHFRNAPKQSLVLMLKELGVFSVNLNIGAPSVEFKGELVLKDSHYNPQQVDISNISHCDGLLLCTTKADRLVVWNPCLGETRLIQLQLITGDKFRYYKFALGYVNNKSCRSYKILVWYDAHKVCRLKIYEFGSDSWRVLDHGSLDYSVEQSNVSLKGNAYWIAYENIDNSKKFLLSFDFTRERFSRLCLPTFQNPGFMVLSSVREEQLSVLHRRFGAVSNIEIWVTSKIDTEAALWSKSFTVDIPIHSHSLPLPMSFLFDEEKKVAVCFNLCPGPPLKYTIEIYYTEAAFAETTQVSRIRRSLFFNYVPSLVQIR